MQAVRSKLDALKVKHTEAVNAANETENELNEINSKAEALENLAEEKSQELNDIEEQLDAAESQLQGQTSQLGTSQKAADESQQAQKILENRGSNDSARISILEKELAELQEKNAVVVEAYETTSTNLQEGEETLDTEEERLEGADARVKQLESEVTQVGNSLRSMEICEKEGVDRVSASDIKISDFQAKYNEKDVEATENEEKLQELEALSDAKDEELNVSRQSYEAKKLELDSLIAEINEM